MKMFTKLQMYLYDKGEKALKVTALRAGMILTGLVMVSNLWATEYHNQTIAQANNLSLLPGDIVYIAAGTYSQTLRPGQSGNVVLT